MAQTVNICSYKLEVKVSDPSWYEMTSCAVAQLKIRAISYMSRNLRLLHVGAFEPQLPLYTKARQKILKHWSAHLHCMVLLQCFSNIFLIIFSNVAKFNNVMGVAEAELSGFLSAL